MKTAEELNTLKAEIKTLIKKLAELTDDELDTVSSGMPVNFLKQYTERVARRMVNSGNPLNFNNVDINPKLRLSGALSEEELTAVSGGIPVPYIFGLNGTASTPAPLTSFGGNSTSNFNSTPNGINGGIIYNDGPIINFSSNNSISNGISNGNTEPNEIHGGIINNDIPLN